MLHATQKYVVFEHNKPTKSMILCARNLWISVHLGVCVHELIEFVACSDFHMSISGFASKPPFVEWWKSDIYS